MVASPARTRRYSIRDLADFPADGKLRELVDGSVVEWDVPTYRHSFLLVALSAEVRSFVRQRRLGQVVGGDTMVRIEESEFDARGADIAFFQRGNRPQDIDAAATERVPDFVVEIISPPDRADRVMDKVRDWLRAGVRLLWYINPQTGIVTVYQGGQIRHLGPGETLDGGDVLPGFAIRLSDLLQELEDG
ncbi:MAG TPA: Uma2 family endonuclease [Chloroflexota bacterium]